MGLAGLSLALATVMSPLLCPSACMEAGDLYSLAVASGIILSSLLLGEALGVIPAVFEVLLGLAAALAGVKSSETLGTLALLGGSFLLFAAGLEVDLELLRRHLRSSLAIGLASFLAPMATATLGAWAAGYPLREAALAGVGVSTTSVAVVYAILKACGLLETSAGQVVLASAMVTDFASILAFIALAVDASVALAVYYASLLVAPPLLRAAFRRLPEAGHEAEVRAIVTTVVLVALFSDIVGVHGILYSFILGVALREALHVRDGVSKKIEGLVFGFLSPVFFVHAGLSMGGVHPSASLLAAALALLAASLPVKVAATLLLLKRMVGLSDPRLSIVFAANLTVAVIIAYTGLARGILSANLAASVVMASLASTLIAGVVAGWGPVESGLESEEEVIVVVVED